MGNPYAGVDADTMTRRQSIVDEFSTGWAGHVGEAFSSDVLVSTLANINLRFRDRPRANLTQWHRIRLDSDAPASAWVGDIDMRAYQTSAPEAIVTNGHLYGSTWDWASAGGGVVIESSDPARPVLLVGKGTMRGIRGVHWRSVNFTSAVADGESRDNAPAMTVTRSGSQPEGPVVRLERCGFGLGLHPSVTDPERASVCLRVTGSTEQLDVIDCQFDQFQTGVVTTGVRRLRIHGCDFKRIIGDGVVALHTSAVALVNSAWTETSMQWGRLNTYRAWLDGAPWSLEHGDGWQVGTSGDIGGYRVLQEFSAMHGRRLLGTDNGNFAFTALPAVGASITIKGVAYTFVASGATGRQINIGATTSATVANARSSIDADPSPPAGLYRTGSESSGTLTIFFVSGQMGPNALQRSTSPAANCTISQPTREAGGTGGHYYDDTSYPVEGVTICSMLGGGGNAAAVLYNGTGVADRVSAFAPSGRHPNASLAIDGFSFSGDFLPRIVSSRNGTVAVDHILRNSVTGFIRDNAASNEQVRTTDGTWTGTNAVLVATNNRYIDWDKDTDLSGGRRPDQRLSGPMGRDADNKWTWTLANEGTITPAQFRAAMYAAMRLSNTTDRAAIGTTDPDDWETGVVGDSLAGSGLAAFGAAGVLTVTRTMTAAAVAALGSTSRLTVTRALSGTAAATFGLTVAAPVDVAFGGERRFVSRARARRSLELVL